MRCWCSVFFGIAITVVSSITDATPPENTRLVFDREFAPAQGIVAAPEKPFRQEVCLNGRWQFQPVAVPESYQRGLGIPPELPRPQAGAWETAPLKVPSPWNVNTWGNGRNAGAGTDRPYTADSVYFPSYPVSWDAAEMGWLRHSFQVPERWQDRRLVLHFEGVAGEVQVLVNGQPAGSHFDSFLPFELDVTDLVKADGENELLVGIRTSSLFDKISPDYPPNQRRTYPNGSNMAHLAGIWSDVFLLGLPAVRVQDVFVKPLVDQGVLEAEVTLRNDTDRQRTVRIAGNVQPWINLAEDSVLTAPEPKWRLDPAVLQLPAHSVDVPPGGTAQVTLSHPVQDQLRYWSPTTPNLYGLVLRIDEAERQLDADYTRFGWRQFKIAGRDLLLNGSKVQLTGDLLHPFGPFIGSRRYAWAWYKMVKDAGGNAVRPHAQPRPRHHLDLADEMGLCLLDESAIFGSSINLNLKAPVTWERLRRHVDGLVRRDRNHPSVFGWSTANEMFALFFRTDPADRAIQFPLLQQLSMRPQPLDPTRPWISVDGDEDLGGVLPVWSKHHGMGLPELPELEKPLMVGEHGATYYGTPPLIEPVVGERAYESYAGRNDGLAVDVYQMITEVARPHLAYFSPSELGWFGVEQLPLGYRTDLRPPTREDGVFFRPFIEGKPGIQVERIPPYSMTFNPGLDPALPLYKPLPMFHAVKAALDPRGPQPCPWDDPWAIEPREHPPAMNHISRVDFLGDREGPLFQSLYLMGVPLAEPSETAESISSGSSDADASAGRLLIIDGEHLSQADAAAVQPLASAVWQQGGLVWVMVREKGAALPQFDPLTPQNVDVTPRRASSLLRGVEDPAIAGFDLGQLYFAEEPADPYIQKSGLAGPLVDSGRVLLKASGTGWALFHQRGEVEKCSNVLIYEHLQKPAGAALVEASADPGRLWISTLDYTLRTPRVRGFWRQLLQNTGVKLGAPPVTSLVPSARYGEGAQWRYTTTVPDAGWQQPGYDASHWNLGQAGFGTVVPNGVPNTPWHSSDIWLRREFTLQELPESLILEVHHDEDIEIFLNGVRIFAERGHLTAYQEIPLDAQAMKALRIGRNVLAVHCLQTAGGQFVDVGLWQPAFPTIDETSRQHNLLLDGPLEEIDFKD